MAFAVSVCVSECDKCRKVVDCVEMYERHKGEQANIFRMCKPCLTKMIAKLEAK